MFTRNQKNSCHLYWLLLAEIRFPPSIMAIRNQSKIPVIDNDYH